jgi:hypothetical protein
VDRILENRSGCGVLAHIGAERGNKSRLFRAIYIFKVSEPKAMKNSRNDSHAEIVLPEKGSRRAGRNATRRVMKTANQ